jgi:hypothetical protein
VTTVLAGSPVPAKQCQGLGRGPLGLIDWGQMCRAFTDPAAALGVR